MGLENTRDGALDHRELGTFISQGSIKRIEKGGDKAMGKRKIVFLTILLILCTGLAAYAVAQKMMSVQVKKGEVRNRPSFLGKIIERLQYGDRVQVQGEKGKWLRIGLQYGAGEGWMHASALS